MEGAPLKVGRTLDFSPPGDFSQSSRPLASLVFSGASFFPKAFSRPSPATPTPSASLNSFPSYSTLSLTSQMEEPQKLPWQLFHPECPTPGPSWIWWSQCFSESIFSPLSNGFNPVHLLQLTPELSHFPLALPMDYHWQTTLCRPHGKFYVEPMY